MKRLDTEKLRSLLEARNTDDIVSGRVGGSAMCVYQDGVLCYKGFFGSASPDGAPVTEDTIFRLASMTKPITAVAALILCDEGKLDLNTPISRWLPDYAEQNIVEPDGSGGLCVVGRAQTSITPLHLLTHTSGLGCGAVGAIQRSLAPVSAHATNCSTAEYYAHAGLAFEPGTTNMYSPWIAFGVMAHIIELISGQDYETFLRKRIFEPCGMEDTTFCPTDEQWSRLICMHDYRDGKACVGVTFPGCIMDDFPCTCHQGGAGLVSTLGNYARFAEMLLGGGKFNGQRILSEKAIDLMRHPYVTPDRIPGSSYSRGLGVCVGTDPADPALPVGSYGWSGTYGTHYWVDPTNRITAVYLKNSRYDGGAGAVTEKNFEADVAAALV